MNTLTITKSRNAIDVEFTTNKITIFLEDGRELSAPLAWFPRLKKASETELKKWRFIGRGQGIHWEDLDEDISVEDLMD